MLPATSMVKHSRVLVDDREAFQLPTVGAGVIHEIVGPHLILTKRRQRSRPARCDAFARPLSRDLQTRLAPDPMRSICAHFMSLSIQEDLDATIPWRG